MGMAASQARYLALVARKSNCEYEGQQINQARTALANQSANLFNQMLGLQVPVPPSTQDFTKVQYSYSDGINASVITEWKQIGGNDTGYNYVVTHAYNTKKYTGSLKLMSDPQVQIPTNVTPLSDIQNARALVIQEETNYKKATEEYNKAVQNYNQALADRIDVTKYADENPFKNTNAVKNADGTYTITHDTAAGTPRSDTYTNYESLTETQKEQVDKAIDVLIQQGALPASFDKNAVYYDITNINIAFQKDIEAVAKNPGNMLVYTESRIKSQKSALDAAFNNAQSEKNAKALAKDGAQVTYENAIKAYNELSHPTYVGNAQLTPLATLTSDQEAELKQIIKDFKEQGITSNLSNYINEDGSYSGGLYTFTVNGVTYYTTYDDLQNSYNSGTGNNNIDGQQKLPYYNASYIDTKVEKTERAIVETDGNGRFTSIRFEDDSVTYKLNSETITDDAAYQDAMNQYYYQNAKYDKMVQDINAKTSIIQHEDQQLELRLKQLETEQNALKTEMEAVQKIVKDNVEKTFNAFGG